MLSLTLPGPCEWSQGGQLRGIRARDRSEVPAKLRTLSGLHCGMGWLPVSCDHGSMRLGPGCGQEWGWALGREDGEGLPVGFQGLWGASPQGSEAEKFSVPSQTLL